MADKGFLLKDDLQPGVTLVLPPFLTNSQFTQEEVSLTYRIASARARITVCEVLSHSGQNSAGVFPRVFQIIKKKVSTYNGFV